MPEMPANQIPGPNGNTGNVFEKGTPERLATPAELAEFGGIVPNPEIEARILELLEAQMKEDMALIEPIDLAEAVELSISEPVTEPVEEPEEETPQASPQDPAIEAVTESAAAVEELPIPKYISEPSLQSTELLVPKPQPTVADLTPKSNLLIVSICWSLPKLWTNTVCGLRPPEMKAHAAIFLVRI